MRGPASQNSFPCLHIVPQPHEPQPHERTHWRRCPVNVHWHLGAEHKNVGTFDQPPPANLDANTRRRLASEGNEAGHWCPAPADDINIVDDYAWEHCSGMHVGYTYELHWPHSNVGMCPSLGDASPKWQYQSHFMDGAPGTLPSPSPFLPSHTPPARPPSRQACFARPTWRLTRAV